MDIPVLGCDDHRSLPASAIKRSASLECNPAHYSLQQVVSSSSLCSLIFKHQYSSSLSGPLTGRTPEQTPMFYIPYSAKRCAFEATGAGRDNSITI